jgi:ATP-dependent DNA ligase
MFQPKFNGHRCVAFYNDQLGEACLYSRGLEFTIFHQLTGQLTAAKDLLFMPNGDKIYLDGELYSPGLTLQDISSLVRTQKDIDKTILRFYIFDLFVPNIPDMIYSERLDLLKTLMPKLTAVCNFIMPVETIFVKSFDDAEKKSAEFIKLGYEGGIVRRIDKPYEYSYNSRHSNYLLKIKNRYDGEFEIVGYIYGGKGRHEKLIKWVVKTAEGHEFNISMNITDDNNTKLGAAFVANPEIFTNNFLGRYVTIEFAELSKDGIPLQSKATNYFRHPNHEEPEVYEKLNKLYNNLLL